MASVTTTAAACLAEATRLYQQGNLHGARDVAEEALLSLSSSTGTTVNSQTTTSSSGDNTTQHITNTAQHRHALFGNALLLLSAVYTAVRDFAEADRLLVTCEGYWREHLGHCAGDASQEGKLEVNEGLAGVAYNRAVLRLEQLDGERAITTQSQSQSQSQQQQQHRREVADAVLHTYLDDARERLDHTLGRQRCLLADVHHSIGVCHLHCRRYVEALSAWQQSLAIRTRVQHRCQADDAAAAAAGDAEELKVALTLEHVAQVYQLLEGRGDEALRMLDAVADTRAGLLGPRHPLYARTLLAKAVLAEKLGRLRLARALLEACHGICGRSDCECDAAFVKDVEQWRCYLKGCTDVVEHR